MVNALILAGDKSHDGKPKALINIAGKYMIEYVIESLRNSKCVDKVYIVGSEGLREKVGHLADVYIKGNGEIVENLREGIKLIRDYEKPCIVCTCDIPMVKGEAIKDFVDKCTALKVDLGYPIIDKRLNDIKYPEAQRTYVKLKDGTYTGGNIIYIYPHIVDKFTNKIEQLVEYRKKPFKMGRALGFTFLIGLATGLLSIKSIEKKVQKMFNIKGSAILTDYPEIGNDVDKPSDIEFVKKYIAI
jgi:GTP:adenosylcobinamide-phosphate guanylyltransferase